MRSFCSKLYENGSAYSQYNFIINNVQLGKAKEYTLFIPSYGLNIIKTSGYNGDKINEEKIKSDFPFKFKVLPNEVLSDKILNTEKTFYYYVLRDAEKFDVIANAKTGEIIYCKTNTITYNKVWILAD